MSAFLTTELMPTKCPGGLAHMQMFMQMSEQRDSCAHVCKPDPRCVLSQA